VAVVGVLAAVGLMLLLVTWAATIGPQEVVTDDGSPPSYPSLTPSESTSESPTGEDTRARGGGDHDVVSMVVTIVAFLLATVLMLALLLTSVRWLLTRDWRRRQREPDPVEIAFDPLDAPGRLAEEMAAAAQRRRELLASGAPRNAIVACWHSFEEQAEAAGVRRQPWETSSEFTLRVLDRLSADDAAVLRLAELYRDARHSEHEITEAMRQRATEALDAIHGSLGGARAHDRGLSRGSP
jgi:hypothetical protein